MHTIANRRAMSSLSLRCVSPMLNPEDFHDTECRFNLLAFFIDCYSIFRSVETDQGLKFGYPVRVLDSTSGEIDILSLVQKELMLEFFLSDFEELKSYHALIFSPLDGFTTQISCLIRI